MTCGLAAECSLRSFECLDRLLPVSPLIAAGGFGTERSFGFNRVVIEPVARDLTDPAIPDLPRAVRGRTLAKRLHSPGRLALRLAVCELVA